MNDQLDKFENDEFKNVLGKLNYVKCKADKFDVDQLTPFPVDLSKLSNVLKKWCC